MLGDLNLVLNMLTLILLALVYREARRCRDLADTQLGARILEELRACSEGLNKLSTLFGEALEGQRAKRVEETNTRKEGKRTYVMLDLNDPAVRQVYEYYRRKYGRRGG